MFANKNNDKEQKEAFKQQVRALVEDIKYQTYIDISKENELGIRIDNSGDKLKFMQSVQAALTALPEIAPEDIKVARDKEINEAEKKSAKPKKNTPSEVSPEEQAAAIKMANVSVIRAAFGEFLKPILVEMNIALFKKDMNKRFDRILTGQSESVKGAFQDIRNRINNLSGNNAKDFEGELDNIRRSVYVKLQSTDSKDDNRLRWAEINKVIEQALEKTNKSGLSPDQKRPKLF